MEGLIFGILRYTNLIFSKLSRSVPDIAPISCSPRWVTKSPRIKSTFELFCLLGWKFLSEFQFFFIVRFLGVFLHYFTTDKDDVKHILHVILHIISKAIPIIRRFPLIFGRFNAKKRVSRFQIFRGWQLCENFSKVISIRTRLVQSS